MTPQEEYKEFINQFIERHSPFEINQLVLVKSFNTVNRPYTISKISLNQDGELFYTLISPRSYSTLPNKFKINDLELFND